MIGGSDGTIIHPMGIADPDNVRASVRIDSVGRGVE
jgi:hypothetical protein